MAPERVGDSKPAIWGFWNSVDKGNGGTDPSADARASLGYARGTLRPGAAVQPRPTQRPPRV